MKIHGLYKHIDNGGVKIEVHQTDDEHKQLYITLNTQYHGYPDISTVLHTWGNVNPQDFLRELGTMFIEAAGKLGN